MELDHQISAVMSLLTTDNTILLIVVTTALRVFRLERVLRQHLITTEKKMVDGERRFH